jgi:hypothetical protein
VEYGQTQDLWWRDKMGDNDDRDSNGGDSIKTDGYDDDSSTYSVTGPGKSSPESHLGLAGPA